MPVIQLTRQLTCLEDAAAPADNSFVSQVMDGFVAQALPLSTACGLTSVILILVLGIYSLQERGAVARAAPSP